MTWRGHLPLALSSYIKDRGRRELSVFSLDDSVSGCILSVMKIGFIGLGGMKVDYGVAQIRRLLAPAAQ